MKRWRWLALELGIVIALLVGTRLLSIFTWNLPDGDVKEYHEYALTFWTVRPWFHALPVEYPPLAILPFSLTMLPPFGDAHLYFAIWMGALVILGYLGFLRYSTRMRAALYVGYLCLGTAAVLLSRFDLVPALITLAALWAAERRYFGHAYVLIAAGILIKLYPGFLLPIVLIEHWRVASARAIAEGRDTAVGVSGWWRADPMTALRRWWERPAARRVARRVARGAVLCLGFVAAGFICALALNPAGTLSGFNYAGARPLQIESTPASILWLGTIFGIPAAPDYSFVSLNYVGVLDVILKPLSALALVAGCLWVYWRQARGSLTIGQAFVACLCAVLVTNKIFSPQYLIWVLPVVAYVEGFDLLWVAISLLTTLDFPIIYQMRHPIWTVSFTAQFMPVLALRNGLLLWATVRAILRRPQRRMAPVDLVGAASGVVEDGLAGQEDAQPALAGQADR